MNEDEISHREKCTRRIFGYRRAWKKLVKKETLLALKEDFVTLSSCCLFLPLSVNRNQKIQTLSFLNLGFPLYIFLPLSIHCSLKTTDKFQHLLSGLTVVSNFTTDNLCLNEKNIDYSYTHAPNEAFSS